MPSDKFPKNSIEGLENPIEKNLEMRKKIEDFKSDPEYLKNLNAEDFKSYKEKAEKFNEYFKSRREQIKNSARYEFWTFLTQKWTSIWLNIQAEEYKRKKKYKNKT